MVVRSYKSSCYYKQKVQLILQWTLRFFRFLEEFSVCKIQYDIIVQLFKELEKWQNMKHSCNSSCACVCLYLHFRRDMHVLHSHGCLHNVMIRKVRLTLKAMICLQIPSFHDLSLQQGLSSLHLSHAKGGESDNF